MSGQALILTITLLLSAYVAYKLLTTKEKHTH
ncbi:Uncharacterised protein [Campylobacter hyointestinalis subsp. hyointestinalis]|uniref:Uncharacterized protein n=1 Tax=Campylobacter hyointestinalis subsp. hyointestinalis TaxID=91352 RepID=A0A0S4RC33_CAMHY|nr:Uncharacterised protein [Campylobacter hyointestinalis subsp. hyointestinalis]CUU71608.1 Uncharacterised protein [Campylobacter hyointestinalis subsp. hyointestinalis]CUU74205.1 Uncharacterised protein [Campylobacter hyointestinalis subsp. hyointestinalis]CUU77549.1 Uncharacterised protein [Campylobacter hyointestinalis subsp. hyointestinalis]CUU82007.1 Uncharacterised protein [Campylobacter hyointestinalis subsp. hyointestinalis]